MLRNGVTPVPVATKSAGVLLVSERVKNPCGPMTVTSVPGAIAWRIDEPGPRSTCVTAISKRAVPFGREAIEYDRRSSFDSNPASLGKTKLTH